MLERIHTYIVLVCLFGAFVFAENATPKNTTESIKVLELMEYQSSLLENGSLAGYLVSEKLDGVRGIWNGKTLFSRNGKPINAPQCFLQHFPPFGLDGELWIGRGQFEAMLKIINTQCEGEECLCSLWEKVGYYVFDVPECLLDSSAEQNLKKPQTDSKDTPKCTLTQRLSRLAHYLEQTPTSRIHIIPQEHITSQHQLIKHLHKLEALGAEGLVIRLDSAPYERKRTKNALKLKSYHDAECKVVAHNAGKGRLSGMLGSITCEQILKQHDKNVPTKTIRFKIGSGFSDMERKNPPPIGTSITYKYRGFTASGIPRFATFYRIYTAP